jgi:hypothetical protein
MRSTPENPIAIAVQRRHPAHSPSTKPESRVTKNGVENRIETVWSSCDIAGRTGVFPALGNPLPTTNLSHSPRRFLGVLRNRRDRSIVGKLVLEEVHKRSSLHG